MAAFQPTPEIREGIGSLPKRALVRGQKNGVDRAGRNTGDDLESKVGKMARQTFDETNLIRGPGAAAGEHDGQVTRGLGAGKIGRLDELDRHQRLSFQTVRQDW